MMRVKVIILTAASLAFAVAAGAQTRALDIVPGHTCAPLTDAHAADSAGPPNIAHDGSALPGIPKPDISKGFNGIPRSAQPPLTASQRRILECSYRLAEANAEMPYALFVPSTYNASKPTGLVVDLHGLNITPLQQMLFDGTTDFAEQYGLMVLAPMGYSLAGWYGARAGSPVDTAQMKPGGTTHYAVGELSEIDVMTLLEAVRGHYNVDADRIFLMGHSMGGAGTYALGAKYNNIWAGLAPLSGAFGIPDAATAERYRNLPMLIMHGASDSIVVVETSRQAVRLLQDVGSQHLYLEFPGQDHEFWIRRDAAHMQHVFLFFASISKKTNVGFVTPEMAQMPKSPAR